MKGEFTMYENLEKKFNVVYPINNATYTSLLNYSSNLNSPFQRWYRYKEGFSVELVKNLIEKYCNEKNGIILDPFLGSGTTVLASNYLNHPSIGYEVNPFSYFLAQVKNENYSKKDIVEFKKNYSNLLNESLKLDKEYKLPDLSFSKKVFSTEIEKYIMNIKVRIDNTKNSKIKKLLLLGWLSSIDIFSNYKKSGNGLKIRKTKKQEVLVIDDVYKYLLEEYNNIYEDISCKRHTSKSKIYNKSSLNMLSDISENTISGIIYSPPYANCFDYTEIYKLELWFGNFVNDYSDLKNLRKKAIRSHLSSNLVNDDYSIDNSPFLRNLIQKLNEKKLWDKKIPIMLKNYYNDMFKIIDDCYKLLKNEGFCTIVIGNSAYGGIVFPTDLILAEYAKRNGFTVDIIDVYRYIIPSSQQYRLTENNKKYLRESVICLLKK